MLFCSFDLLGPVHHSKEYRESEANMRHNSSLTCESPPPVSPAPSSTDLYQTDKQIAVSTRNSAEFVNMKYC